ncbi:GerW family sporulation protein [Virgibacillus ihumii]|uniref:GerW family sporulation protein n=1 Tax=Virgibacillus ihumii TaxID=2686091 RepID=UPI00157C5A2A|nr:GerW family sporulation protein [Virgibacillus ihumii]
MSEHPIQGLMTTAMENLKDMIEVNTIIGDPVESPDGSIIVPVSKVGFGFAAGGSEFSSGGGKGDDSGGDSLPFGGGSGGGVSITPVAFLIVSQKGIKMIHMDENVHLYEKMINFAPQAVEKIQQIIKESAQSNKNKKGGQQQKKQDKENNKENNQDSEKKNNQGSGENSQQTDYDI